MASVTEKALFGVLVVLILGFGSVIASAEFNTEPVKSEIVKVDRISPEAAVALLESQDVSDTYGEMTDFEVEFENGQTVYSAEFTNEEFETEIMIDPRTGNILGIEHEAKPVIKKEKIKITEQEARDIAVAEIGGRVIEVELEREFGRDVYEVEIETYGVEADVFVDLETGEVVGIEWEDEDD